MFELFQLKPSRCSSKIHAKTNNAKFILPWDPVYKRKNSTESKPSSEKSSANYTRTKHQE